MTLGRRSEDDRDHFGNKRMDMAGSLIGMLFRQLFRKLTKDVRLYAQRCIDSGKDIQLTLAVKVGADNRPVGVYETAIFTLE